VGAPSQSKSHPAGVTRQVGLAGDVLNENEGNDDYGDFVEFFFDSTATCGTQVLWLWSEQRVSVQVETERFRGEKLETCGALGDSIWLDRSMWYRVNVSFLPITSAGHCGVEIANAVQCAPPKEIRRLFKDDRARGK
jgi:hypothetical protein